ncbi:MAG: hypothetical protein LBI99_06135 [Propionibacteriaceae bacterium]|jgi:hypothetical protein|nr:hypothetical protein [Propionibacteriaceae bacterium]
MSTRGIAETLLDYPFLFGAEIFYNTPQAGFDAVVATTDTYRVLTSRKDAGQALLKIYQYADLAKMARLSEAPSFDLRGLESILAQDVFLDQLDADQRKELLKSVATKYLVIVYDYPEKFSVDYTLWLGLKVLCHDDEQFAALVKSSEMADGFAQTGLLVGTDAEMGAFWHQAAILLAPRYAPLLADLDR